MCKPKNISKLVTNARMLRVASAGAAYTVNPFVSEDQRAWMHINHPEMAKRWEAHTPKGKKLPKVVKKVRNRAIANPLRIDPTRTVTLRRAFSQKVRKQWATLKGRIVKLIVDEDAFGLRRKVGQPGALASTVDYAHAYNYEPFHDALGRFAAAATSAAEGSKTGKFGDNKTFISHAHAKYNENQKAAGKMPQTLEQFKGNLIKANKAGLVSLSRADLPHLMNPKDLDASSTQRAGDKDTGSVHFIVHTKTRNEKDALGHGSDKQGGSEEDVKASVDAKQDAIASAAAKLGVGLTRAIADKITQTVKAKYDALSSRYGSKYAKAIIGAAVLGAPLPVPGSSFLTAAPVIAVAELHRLATGRGRPAVATANESTANVNRTTKPMVSSTLVGIYAQQLIKELRDELNPDETRNAKDALGHGSDAKGTHDVKLPKDASRGLTVDTAKEALRQMGYHLDIAKSSVKVHEGKLMTHYELKTPTGETKTASVKAIRKLVYDGQKTQNAFDPEQERDEHGRWSSSGVYTLHTKIDSETMFSEQGQDEKKLASIREHTPKGGPYTAGVAMRKDDGDLEIMDGHHRATVAEERDDHMPMVTMAQKDVEHLTSKGYSHPEIVAAALYKAGHDHEADHVAGKFNVKTRSKEAAEQLTKLPDEKPPAGLSQKNTKNTRWTFRTDSEKINAFQEWLKEQMKDLIVGADEERLWQSYIQQGFAKGAGRSFDLWMQKRADLGIDEKQPMGAFYQGSKAEFMRSSFAQPETVDKVKLLAGRAFDDLDGVTSDMSVKMSRSLTDGLVQGMNPRDIAKNLNEVTDVGSDRAELIARTEIIRAHAEGQLNAFDDLGVEEVGVAAEWSTAADGRVCDECEPMEGVVLTVDEAKGMIPRHPDCRCAWIPANVGEEQDDQTRSQRDIKAAIRDSDEDGEWTGSDKKIGRSRPESTFLGNRVNPFTRNASYKRGIKTTYQNAWNNWLRRFPSRN